jgi:PiT family inorganic phosphate transporter
MEGLLGRHETIAGVPGLRRELAAVRADLEGRGRIQEIPEARRAPLRADLLRVAKDLDALGHRQDAGLSDDERAAIGRAVLLLRGLTEYAPTWVLVAVATALGVGTTVGWKRIVETVGERIGKAHLSYAQGACAELVAMSTIGLADLGGLPVSTTHVLSSGVAGTMAANRSGLQWATIRNIALAWILTLPAAMALAAGLFLLFRLGVR